MSGAGPFTALETTLEDRRQQVEEALRRNKLLKYVCDPVIFSRSGDRLLNEEGVAALKAKLLPLASSLTRERLEL